MGGFVLFEDVSGVGGEGEGGLGGVVEDLTDVGIS